MAELVAVYQTMVTKGELWAVETAEIFKTLIITAILFPFVSVFNFSNLKLAKAIFSTDERAHALKKRGKRTSHATWRPTNYPTWSPFRLRTRICFLDGLF